MNKLIMLLCLVCFMLCQACVLPPGAYYGGNRYYPGYYPTYNPGYYPTPDYIPPAFVDEIFYNRWYPRPYICDRYGCRR